MKAVGPPRRAGSHWPSVHTIGLILRLFYAGKDYSAEASAIAQIIRERQPGAAALLDVGCGTGRHLEQLRHEFVCEGLDLDSNLLAVARNRLPGVTLSRGNMTDFCLDRKFDVVTCLFGAIGYAASTDDLDRTVATMAHHLRTGGVLIVEPWVLLEDWIEPGTNAVNEVEDGTRRLVRVISSRREGALSHLRIHYVVAEAGVIDTADEDHVLGLFTRSDYLGAYQRAGFAGSWIDEPLFTQGLVVGARVTDDGTA